MGDVLEGFGRPLGLAPTVGASVAAHVAAFALMLLPRAGAAPAAPPADPPPAAAGETFELPAPESEASEGTTAEPPPSSAPPAAVSEPDDHATPRPAPAKPTRTARPGARPASEGSAGSSAPYGAVGDRSASDLATAFTRGFPQAASADPAWRTAPLGPTGAAEVVLTISEAGRLESSQIVGAPNAALASGIRRTLALVQGRTFIAHGKTTRLHVTGTVSTDSVHDGLHGDVFAIGGSYAGGEGSAFFALAMGRRIDVRVRLAR